MKTYYVSTLDARTSFFAAGDDAAKIEARAIVAQRPEFRSDLWLVTLRDSAFREIDVWAQTFVSA